MTEISDLLLTFADSINILLNNEVLRALVFGIMALIPIKAFLLLIKH